MATNSPTTLLNRYSSGAVRAMQYVGDNMEPTIAKLDSVVFEPQEHYTGEGIYLVEQFGGISVYRVQSNGRGKLQIMSDNKRYSGRGVDLTWFNEHCFGRVIGVYHQMFTPRGGH